MTDVFARRPCTGRRGYPPCVRRSRRWRSGTAGRSTKRQTTRQKPRHGRRRPAGRSTTRAPCRTRQRLDDAPGRRIRPRRHEEKVCERDNPPGLEGSTDALDRPKGPRRTPCTARTTPGRARRTHRPDRSTATEGHRPTPAPPIVPELPAKLGAGARVSKGSRDTASDTRDRRATLDDGPPGRCPCPNADSYADTVATCRHPPVGAVTAPPPGQAGRELESRW